ncbi:MAG: class I SAM-dependent rRNA methyltransferase [Elusimicrobia bacterium]|nr:class I SAM-dependent rRNA methyltransferase [Elusimicrobiota bacterium]
MKVTEDGLEFWVSLKSSQSPSIQENMKGTVPSLESIRKMGQKTGFYFDQRENRAFLTPFFKDRRVLDLYCYVGAFALHAARAGAQQVWGVDSSDVAVGLAQANAELNHLSHAAVFRKEDAEHVLAAFCVRELPVQPDFVLLDPPNLVPNKRSLPKSKILYVKLNALALRGLPKGGLLGTSCCSHHVSREMFLEILRQAAGKAQKQIRVLELRGQAKDHPVLLAMPETEYLHFALLEVV